MAIINMVRNIKEVHKEDLLCFKVGNFCQCYGKDTYIMQYLFEYNIKQTKDNVLNCGFPLQALRKVEAKLEQNKINYIVLDTKNEYSVMDSEDYKNLNKYQEFINKSTKYVRVRKRVSRIQNMLICQFDSEKIDEKIEEIEKIVYES